MIEFIEGNLNSSIEQSIKIAVHYLSSNHQRIYKLINLNENTIKDMAIDAVASLFISEGNDKLPIKKAFDNWHPSIKTVEEFNFFLQKVVAKRTEQHISRILRESDPLFSTILDSINYLIKKNHYGKTRYMGAIYIIESNSKKINGKVLSNDIIYSIPCTYFSSDKNMLRNLFEYLKTETDFFPAIPRNALIIRFKELKSAGFCIEDTVESYAKTYEFSEFINISLKEAKNKLESYISKKKLSEPDAEKMFEALKDLSEDLKNGGINPGLYEYLSPHFQNLTIEDYKRKYHNIFEYLFKVIRNNIAHELHQ